MYSTDMKLNETQHEQEIFNAPWHGLYKPLYRNYIGGMNIIFPKDIPSDFMMMERESALSPEISHRCSLGWRSDDCGGRSIRVTSFLYSLKIP